MARALVFGLVGLLVGLGAASAMVVVREGEARATALPVVADTLAADTLAADSLFTTLPDSATLAALRLLELQDSLTVARVLARPQPASAPDTAAVLAAVPAPDTAAPMPPPADTAAVEPALDQDRLAKLFATMQPKEAARVLEQMDDTEVQIILSHLQDRQAAAILSSLPPQRAAGISQAVMRNARSTP